MIIPVGHKILVKKLKLEERDPVFKKAVQAGIALPEHDDLKRRDAGIDRGEVVAVGPTAFREYQKAADYPYHEWISPGDMVVFAKYGGMIVEDPDTEYEYILINDADVVAKVIANE